MAAAKTLKTIHCEKLATANNQCGGNDKELQSVEVISNNANPELNQNSNSYQRVADRIQQWNRTISKDDYITLGTIRYGVRLSSADANSDRNNQISIESSSSITSSSTSIIDASCSSCVGCIGVKKNLHSWYNGNGRKRKYYDSNCDGIKLKDNLSICTEAKNRTTSDLTKIQQSNQTKLPQTTSSQKTTSSQQIASSLLQTAVVVHPHVSTTTSYLQTLYRRKHNEKFAESVNFPMNMSDKDTNSKSSAIPKLSKNGNKNHIPEIEIKEFSSITPLSKQIINNKNKIQTDDDSLAKFESVNMCQTCSCSPTFKNSDNFNNQQQQPQITNTLKEKFTISNHSNTEQISLQCSRESLSANSKNNFIKYPLVNSNSLPVSINSLNENISESCDTSESSILSTTVCCYKSVRSKSKNNSNKISGARVKNNHESLIPRAILNQTLDNSIAESYSNTDYASKIPSLKRYQEKNSTLQNSSPSPPPVPPKPPKQERPTSLCRSRSVDSTITESSYDPINFRRKIQKFEENNFLISPQQNRIFNCFSAGKSINSKNGNYFNHDNRVNETEGKLIDKHNSLLLRSNKSYDLNLNANTINTQSPNERTDLKNTINYAENLSKVDLNSPTELHFLRYNSSGLLIDDFESTSSINSKFDDSSSDSQLKSYDEQPISTTTSLVFQKLTPKLSKKSFKLSNEDRGISEDRLIEGDDLQSQVFTDLIATKSINNFNLNLLDVQQNDIGFIDSSSSTTTTTNSSVQELLTPKEYSENLINLRNKENLIRLNQEQNNNTIKKDGNCVKTSPPNSNYESLSDDLISPISFLSDDNLCNCQNSYSNKENLNENLFNNNNKNNSEHNLIDNSDHINLVNYKNNNNNNNNNDNLINFKNQLNKKLLVWHDFEKRPTLIPLPLPPPYPNVLRSQSAGNNLNNSSNNNHQRTLSGDHVKRPILKKVPEIESFGFIQQKSHSIDSGPSGLEKVVLMDRRRNTLDRWQRLGFGRRSTPSPTPSDASNRSRKSSEKSERLKELTELLRGTRQSSPTPPPLPPPRKPRGSSQPKSFEKPPEKPPDPEHGMSPLRPANSDDILPMDEEDNIINTPINEPLTISLDTPHFTPEAPVSAPVKYRDKSPTLNTNLRANASLSNLDSLLSLRNKESSKSFPPPPPPPPPPPQSDVNAQSSRCHNRTILGTASQKGIPFRSASFSQIDYASGKYIKSALTAWRDKFRRDKTSEPSVVDRANLTLPRKKDSSPKRDSSPEYIYIPLKSPEYSFCLKNEKSDNDRIEVPEMIMEEESIHSEGDKSPAYPSSPDFSLKTENFASIPDEFYENDSSIIINNIPTAGSTNLGCETNLATLREEEVFLESPPENFLQTATTCLIPVPVYECTSKDWNSVTQNQQWVEVECDEMGPELLNPIPTVLNSSNLSINSSTNQGTDNTDVPTTITDDLIKNQSISEDNGECITFQQINDQVPIISVSQDTPRDSIDEISLPTEMNPSKLYVENDTEEKLFEFPEVKKRYSNDEVMKISGRTLSVDSVLSRGGNTDEKRRIDKSKRRKGMYIQWPAMEKEGLDSLENSDWNQSTESSSADDKALTVDLKNIAFSDVKTADSVQDNESLILSCQSPEVESLRTAGSICSFDPSTPESDCNYSRPPMWPRNDRRTSLTCQSSEEKDDFPKTPDGNLLLFKNDSTSENETDKTPPPSRDHTSPSPAPGDQDLKRYSKRPLRGPYGQMLEKEMKKLGKVQYDEILDEFKDNENLIPLPTHSRGASNRSLDETRSVPQYSSSLRVRKTSAYLPLPTHTRAASTPSQMENISTSGSSMEKIQTQDKRYQSSLDTVASPDTSTSRFSLLGRKDSKKFDCRERSPKRASSEIPDIKQQQTLHAKRSSSTVSDRHLDKNKRSLEEIRLSSRTPSERSMISDSGRSFGNLMPTPELLATLLKGSSEKQVIEQRQQMLTDTRTHVVQELFDTEQSYVEALHTVVVKYLNVLTTPEFAGIIDSRTVDEIFYMIPEILSIHQKFLNQLQIRLDSWDSQQKVGDAFIETFSKTEVLETYTCFVNNHNRAKDAIRMTTQARPAFAKFLESSSREHKNKLSLDTLLIKPVQKFPNYLMLFKRLIKYTDIDHPDQKPLQDVLKLVQEILIHLDCKEKEVNENGQREATLKDLENVIEGMSDLVAPERQFLLFDLVSMPSGQGARKERGFFLFSDLLIITSIKRRSGPVKKPVTVTCPGSIASTLDTNKYKFLTKVSLENMEIMKTKDENLRKKIDEIEQLVNDSNKLQKISELSVTIKYPHQALEETIREIHREVQRQLSERQSNDAQLNILELSIQSPGGHQNFTVVFSKAEKRSLWEETFNEAKLKLAATLERHPIPEFITSIPIRKTRAGLQFTCAAPTLSSQKDVWVCNSDGYIGQVGVLSIHPEPTVTSCNGVCNARILCIASVPAFVEEIRKSRESSAEETTPQSSRNSTNSSNYNLSANQQQQRIPIDEISSHADCKNDIQLDSNSSSEDSEPEGSAGGSNDGSNVPETKRIPSPTPTTVNLTLSGLNSTGNTISGVFHHHQNSSSDETDGQQATMWLGTEDGCIHVYNCTDNIRIKKNKIKIEHTSSVYSILYLDNRVFVALANGDICVYLRDNAGWNTSSPLCISIGSVSSPVTKLLNVHGKLWCSMQGIIKILDTKTLQVENQIQISSDSKPITNLAVCNNYVWISILNSALLKCYHSISHELLFEVNLAASVNKMLSNCDDIIRQHKAACLRVTSLLACKDLIWIGTSAGVLLTVPAAPAQSQINNNNNNNNIVNNKSQMNNNIPVTGIPHGHTGHVRFLTFVESNLKNPKTNQQQQATKTKIREDSATNTKRHSIQGKSKLESTNILIISGGDGYENFSMSSANSLSEIAGREDSTNHLLLWQI